MADRSVQGKRVAILATDGVEQVELTEPRKALDEAGAKTTVISPKSGTIKGWQHDHWGDEIPVDLSLDQALEIYRAQFQPSERLREPYVMLGVNVFAAETEREARRLFTSLQQAFINLRRGRPGPLKPPDEGFEGTLAPFERAMLSDMLSYTVVGTRDQVRTGLAGIVERTGANELMIASQIYDHGARVASYELAGAG
jgi:alkanesulfonate monooxygenase SsuD/methylene tetrahydromethanopterin reductase-like flavin-dependent oxidoreductase (luciferase family)